VLSLPDEIRSLNAADMHELEDFVREALVLLLSGQFPREAYENVGMNSGEIETIYHARKEIARGTDYAYFRKLFRREMHSTVVTNMKKVGLLNDRTTAFMRDMGIDTNLASAA
jgi:hypothetical protein